MLVVRDSHGVDICTIYICGIDKRWGGLMSRVDCEGEDSISLEICEVTTDVCVYRCVVTGLLVNNRDFLWMTLGWSDKVSYVDAYIEERECDRGEFLETILVEVKRDLTELNSRKGSSVSHVLDKCECGVDEWDGWGFGGRCSTVSYLRSGNCGWILVWDGDDYLERLESQGVFRDTVGWA
ncbi:hypothetical protein Tco_1319645 [Tanacetum coccineum]